MRLILLLIAGFVPGVVNAMLAAFQTQNGRAVRRSAWSTLIQGARPTRKLACPTVAATESICWPIVVPIFSGSFGVVRKKEGRAIPDELTVRALGLTITAPAKWIAASASVVVGVERTHVGESQRRRLVNDQALAFPSSSTPKFARPMSSIEESPLTATAPTTSP